MQRLKYSSSAATQTDFPFAKFTNVVFKFAGSSTVFLKIPKKNLTFIATSSDALETFGESFLPLEIFFSGSFRLFYTVNNQNLKKSEKIHKGQNRFTQGFLKMNV